MNNDLISRSAVLRHLRECEGTPPEIAYTYPLFKALERFVEDIPAAYVRSNYCPNCGAKMDGEEEHL